MGGVWEWGLCDYPPDEHIPGPEETTGRRLVTKPKRPSIGTIRKRATEESIKNGERLNRDGGVIPFGSDRGLFTARILDGETHMVVASLGYGGGRSYCTCPHDEQGICGHVAAALLYASRNFAQVKQDEKRHQECGADDVLDRLAEAQLREFLSKEMNNDPELKKRFMAKFEKTGVRRNVRADLDEAYYQMGDAGHFGGSVFFDDYMAAAKSGAKIGDYDEAIRICREIIDVVHDNMENVDDSYAHYGTALQMALDHMHYCIRQQNLDHLGRRRHISYLHGRAAMDGYGFAMDFEKVLSKICTTGKDRAYLKSLDG